MNIDDEKIIFEPMPEEERKRIERPLGSSSKPLAHKEAEPSKYVKEDEHIASIKPCLKPLGLSFLFSEEFKLHLTKYRVMTELDLNILLNDDKNNFNDIEREAINVAYREKHRQKSATKFKIPATSFNKKCPFCGSILSNKKNICEGCGTGFSNNPSLIFGDLDDIVDSETDN